MKNILAILTLLILVSCGDAERITVDSKLFKADTPPPALMAGIELDPNVREIISFAFPNEDEVENFEYRKSLQERLTGYWHVLFLQVNNGTMYAGDITKDMRADQKVQDLVGKVLTIAEARDKSWRDRNEVLKASEDSIKSLGTKLKKLSCYKVRKGKNKNKCYLNSIRGVTSSRPTKLRGKQGCSSLTSHLNKYVGLDRTDPKVLAGMESMYYIAESTLIELTTEAFPCYERAAFETIRAEGKTIVADMMGTAGEAAGVTLLAKGSSQLDDAPGASEIIFDAKTMKFTKFNIAMDFETEGVETKDYNPDNKNMTHPIVKEINGSGYYQVDFTIFTDNFRLETQGLSLAIDDVFGLRMSGKTLLYYNDGTVRRGIMRIDLDIKK